MTERRSECNVFCRILSIYNDSKSIEKILKFSMIIYVDENSSSPLNLQTP